MKLFLEYYPTNKISSHHPQFLVACNWILSCNLIPGVIDYIDSPQGGGPMK